jgi:hypothetical protein
VVIGLLIVCALLTVPAALGWRKAEEIGAIITTLAFVVTFVVVSVGVTLLAAGPPEPIRDCGYSDCDGNLKYLTWFIVAGLPAGLIAGAVAVLAALRLAARVAERRPS